MLDQRLEVVERATELLLRQITVDEYYCLKKNGYISVMGRGLEYRLYPKTEWNVSVFRGGERIMDMASIFSTMNIPLIDLITAQYILLKANEDFYVQNFCARRRP